MWREDAPKKPINFEPFNPGPRKSPEAKPRNPRFGKKVPAAEHPDGSKLKLKFARILQNDDGTYSIKNR